jgi:LysR family transcriptional regulator, glycine cleavage system transcriptional activator
MPKTPSLLSLRAFDASSRNLSFTKAARELNLTQSAVSRHIRHLEEHLGLTLFERGYRKLVLTKDGELYGQDICAAFRQIERATLRMVRATKKQELHIHSHTYIAAAWLVPRLIGFNEAHPDIAFQLTASAEVDFSDEATHGVIRRGTGGFAVADKMFDINLVPVCSPAMARRFKRPRDLGSVTLLHTLAAPSNWTVWLAGVRETDVDPMRGYRFESTVLACAAARNGLGVALAHDILVKQDLDSGNLVKAIDITVPANKAYYFVRSPQHPDFEALEKFRSWLLAECPKVR